MKLHRSGRDACRHLREHRERAYHAGGRSRKLRSTGERRDRRGTHRGRPGGAHNTSGSLDVRDSRLPEFHCHSVSGRLAIETPLSGRQYHLHTVSGSVRVQIPPDTGVTVQMKSVSGDVTCDLPAQIVKSGRRSWQGVINGGGATKLTCTR